MKIKTSDEADVNITSLIDCLMQCIIFFMVIMSVQYVFGVAIKFGQMGPSGKNNAKTEEKKEKDIIIFVGADQIEENHRIVHDGVLKINGEEMSLVYTDNPAKWDEERKMAFRYLKEKIGELLRSGYSKEEIIIQGEMFAYHSKIMAVIDQGKANKIAGFSLVPAE